MKPFPTIALAAAMFGLSAGISAAQDATISYSVVGVTDYVFRGVSQTNEDPALQAAVDVTTGNFYLGAWASNVDYADTTEAEIDVYAGYRTEVGGFAVDIGAITYIYIDQPRTADYNYVEAKLAVSRAFGPLTAGAAIFYSPNFFGADDEAVYIESNLGYVATDRVTLSGAVGTQILDVTEDYVTWNAGATFAVTDQLSLDARYHDTDIEGLSIAEQRFVAALKLAF